MFKVTICDLEARPQHQIPSLRLHRTGHGRAIEHNRARFPADFIFQLSRDEAEEWRRLRSQSVTLKRGGDMRSQSVTASEKRNVRYQPYAFTEQVVPFTPVRMPVRDRTPTASAGANPRKPPPAS